MMHLVASNYCGLMLLSNLTFSNRKLFNCRLKMHVGYTFHDRDTSTLMFLMHHMFLFSLCTQRVASDETVNKSAFSMKRIGTVFGRRLFNRI